jgi:hypothetical protein
MIGTSDFNFPVVVHSEKFVPNRERDGIELTDFDDENRDRLIEAKEGYLKALQIIEENEWDEAFELCRLSKVEINDHDTKQWYVKNIFDPIKEGVYNAKIIELDHSLDVEKRIALNAAYVPYADKRASDKEKTVQIIYDLAFRVIPESIPSRQHYLRWYQALDFEIFSSEKLDIEQLCSRVSFEGSLSGFADKTKMKEDEALNYLVDLIEFLIGQNKREMLEKYSLLLNQSKDFCVVKTLHYDFIKHKGLKQGYGEKLKDIYYSLSRVDCRKKLLHKAFEKIHSLIDEDDICEFKELARDTDDELKDYEGNFHDEDFLLILKDLFNWYTKCGLPEGILIDLFPYFSSNKSQLYLNTKTPQELEYAFDIEISGKSEVLAKLANSSLSENELHIISENAGLVSSFIQWLNTEHEDNPDEELGDIGEKFLYHQLCQIFGENRVLWEDKSEYDFRILEPDLKTTKYFIDAKTTGKGIANSDNVPFFMRMAQWKFLDNIQVLDKYIVARIFKDGDSISVKYLMMNKQTL